MTSGSINNSPDITTYHHTALSIFNRGLPAIKLKEIIPIASKKMNGHTNGNSAPGLPSAKPFNVSNDIVIQPPLSRRGNGPGLLLLVPEGLDLNGSSKTLDPPPLQKWAEEGWAVAQLTISEGSSGDGLRIQLKEALKALSDLKDCDSIEKTGLICRSMHL